MSTAPRTRHEERALRYAPAKLAQNVQAVVYGLPDADRENLRLSLKAAGFRVFTFGKEFFAFSSLDHGTSRMIYVQPSAPGRIGLLAIAFRLNRVEMHTEQLGDATLRVGIAGLPLAMLWFVPPTAGQEATLTSLAN